MNGIVISRVFDAPRELVWRAWTNQEMVKKWWGPKDFTAPVIQIDFREGGKYLYCMHGPKGTEFDRDMYSAGVYKEIVPMERIVVSDYFSDEKGNKIDPATSGMSPDFPKEVQVIVRFEDAGNNKTKLTIEYPRPESDAEFEAMRKSGMEAGWNQSLDKLAETL
ncbi:SRPBCC domain-containing protein [Candidatus Collierbacteria bacterium]|nr:SRPBCC domain-containing protein [Candidatus Collierbacteria bacterium]